jgi:hypothetical protein
MSEFIKLISFSGCAEKIGDFFRVVTPINKSSSTDADSNKLSDFPKTVFSQAKEASSTAHVSDNSNVITQKSTSEKSSTIKDEISRTVKVANKFHEKLEIPQVKPRPQIVREPFCPGDFLNPINCP